VDPVRRIEWLLSASVSTVALLAACPGAQAGPSGCARASHARGTKIRGHDAVAVVFTREEPGGIRDYYACLKAGRRVIGIPHLCCSDVQFKLAGRFLLYTYRGSAIGDESNKIGLLDLRTGRLEPVAKLHPHAEGAGREIDDGELVVKLLVTSAGAAFWLEYPTAASEPPYDLRGAIGTPKAERIIDAGKIDPSSLRLSRDGRTLLFTNGGLPKSVGIDRFASSGNPRPTSR